MNNNSTLVLGIGNTILSDEGTGIHVLDYLRNNHTDLEKTELLDGGTLSFVLAADIEDTDNLVVIDAAQLKAPPGTVQVMVGEEMDKFIGTGKLSVHEVGLLDLMDIARLTGCLPVNRALVGIQPKKMDWGCDLSPEVADAVPDAARQVANLVKKWNLLPDKAASF